MVSPDQLENVANRYRVQGYRVAVRPGPEELPAFAKDFKVEILAERGDGGVLASIKGDLADFENDRDLPRYAEAIERQPGWRYDVSVLGPARPHIDRPDVHEASEAEVAKGLDVAERLLHSGFTPQALSAAWAAAESAMRHRLRALGERTEWGDSSRTMINELYSSGVFSPPEFRGLERLSALRNIIVHGFSVPDINPDDVSTLIRTAKRLIEESSQVEAAP